MNCTLPLLLTALLGANTNAQESPVPDSQKTSHLSCSSRGQATKAQTSKTERGPAQYIPRTTRPAHAEPASAITMPAPAVDHTRLYWDRTKTGEYWVRGADYKASFAPGGFQFIPFLGAQAPRNFPLRLRLQSVQGSEGQWNLEPLAQVTREGNILTLDRGRAVEIYRVELGAIEQSFDLGPVKGPGPLILKLAVETELMPSRAGSSWRFSNDWGGVDYGQAKVLDGAGRSAILEVELLAGGLQIVVPGSFLEKAEGRILVDPLLSTFMIANATDRFDNPDVAYSFPSDRYCSVYEDPFSATDGDIYSRILDGFTGADLGLGEYIDFTTDDWSAPSVAFQLDSNVFMVVAESIDQGATETSIRGRIRNPQDTTMLAQLDIELHGIDYECKNPDVGGDVFAGSGSFFAIVWERDYGTDSDIHSAVYRADGSVHRVAQGLYVDVLYDLTEPVISKSVGVFSSDPRYYVAWAHTAVTGNGPGSIQVQRLRFSGEPVGNRFFAISDPARRFFDLDVSEGIRANDPGSNFPYYLIVFDDDSTGNQEPGAVLCAGEQAISEIVLPVTEHAGPILDRDHPKIATSANGWLVIYAERNGVGAPLHWDLRAVALQPVGGVLALNEEPFHVTAFDFNDPTFDAGSICSTVSGGAPDTWTDAMVTFANDFGIDRAISGALLSSNSDAACGYQYCYGEANSTGDRAVILALGTNDTTSVKSLKTFRMPANQFCYLLVGSGQAYVPNAGGSDGDLCIGGSLGRYNLAGEVGFSGAQGVFNFDVNPQLIRQLGGSVSAVSGQTWHFQTWFRDTQAGSGHSNFSNGVSIPF